MKTIRMFRAVLLGGSALAAITFTSEARAAAADQSATLGEIVVTAQKREQSLQDVPVAVTAVNQDALKVNRVTSIMDLNSLAPNLTVMSATGGAKLPLFVMRGEVSSSSAPGQDKSLSINIDGVYVGNAYGLGFDLPNLERIEVLRGPQGTLFGRNSTAGAINIITRDPTGQFAFHQELTGGNYDQFRSATRVETPAWGPLSASINYVHDERRGDIRNLGAGTVWDRSASGRHGVEVSPKWLGDRNADTVFLAVKFEPSDSFNTVYKFDWTEDHYTPNGSGIVLFTPEQAGLGFLRPIFDANPPPISGRHRPKAVNDAFTTPALLKAYGHNVTTTVRVNDQLSFKNILAYRYNYVYVNMGYTGAGGLINTLPFLGPVGAPYVIADSQSEASAKQWSDELQLSYNSKLLTLTAGAVYYNNRTVSGAPDGLAGQSIFGPVPGGRLAPGRDLTLFTGISKAAYVQAEVHVTSQVDVVGGYRMTKDTKHGTTFIATRPLPFTSQTARPSYMAGVNYKPTRDILLYGKYASGFVSGGSVAGFDFLPETASSWEAGLKADLFDRRLRANLASFWATYRHIQQVSLGTNIGRPDLGAVILDQGDGKARGFEAEVTAAPVRGVTLSGAVGYTHFRFTRTSAIFNQFGAFERWNLPKWTANFAASYETEPLFGEARLMARLDGNWSSRIPSPGVYLPVKPGYQATQYSGETWMLNGRLALTDIQLHRGKLEVAVWSKNLLDKDGPAFPLQFGPNPYIGTTTYLPARTIGLDLIYDY